MLVWLKKRGIIKNNFCLPYIKIDKKIIKFGETGTQKQQFHQHKNPILIYDVEINKILVSKKVSFGRKGF